MNLEIGTWPSSYACCPGLDIAYDDFHLRPLRWNDRLDIRQWRNAQIPILRQRSKLTVKQQDEYFDQIVANEMRTECPPQVLLGLDFSGELVAYGGLVHINWLDRHAEMSFLTDPKYCNINDHRRLLTIFVKLISQLALNELGLHRLFTETYSSRVEHMEMLESMGFRKEGVLVDHVIINGEFVNSIMHGLILE